MYAPHINYTREAPLVTFGQENGGPNPCSRKGGRKRALSRLSEEFKIVKNELGTPIKSVAKGAAFSSNKVHIREMGSLGFKPERANSTQIAHPDSAAACQKTDDRARPIGVLLDPRIIVPSAP